MAAREGLMTLTARILKELENGPATSAELAAILCDRPAASVVGTLCNLLNMGRIQVVGKVLHRRSRGGRKENLYALPGTPALNASPEPQKRPVSDPDAIAGGAYRIAGRITVKQIKFPARANRGFSQ